MLTENIHRAIDAYFKHEPVIPGVIDKIIQNKNIGDVTFEDKVKILQLTMNSWAFVMLADSVNCTERELHLDTAKYKLNLSEKEAEEVYQKALSTLKVDDIAREYEY